jgi:heptosyltransferase-3
LGSLGDTLVALPALNLVARHFPNAQRRVLTERSAHPKAASMATLLEGTGLVHDYYWFPMPKKNENRFGPMLRLARDIRAWKPEVLIYMHEQRGQMIALRDAAIFRMLGIRRLVGVPLGPTLQRRVFLDSFGRFEHRSEYLARSLAFSSLERRRAAAELESVGACTGLLAMSIGTKFDVKDWGDANWHALLTELSVRLPGWGLIALGAPVEHERSSALLTSWRGASLNLCGKLSVRESGAVLQRVRLFVGHDSGPMHLAASVGTRCAAIFSARNMPGLWFPYGAGHTVFYKKTECAGCDLTVCIEFKKKCITAVTVDEVSTAVMRMISAPLTDTVSAAT